MLSETGRSTNLVFCNGLEHASGGTDVNVATDLLPFQGRINGRSTFAIVGSEHVRIDAQRDARLGMPEALADGDNIDPASDQLGRMRVP